MTTHAITEEDVARMDLRALALYCRRRQQSGECAYDRERGDCAEESRRGCPIYNYYHK